MAALKLSEGRAPVRDRLIAMLCLMALLHAIVILGVTFGTGEHGGGATPELDVLLVTNEVPEARSNPHATYLAQRTQLGAGDTDAHVPPGSPASRGALATATQPRDGQDLRDHSEPMQPRAQQVLSTTGASPDIRYLGEQPDTAGAQALPEMLGDTAGEPRSGRGDAVELLLRGKASAGRWVSPDTRASTLAPYLAEWKRKVERVGTLNFPSAARRQGLSGSPVVAVEIAASGQLRQARVQRSSGYGALDQAALTILRLASPFSPFPSALAARYSRLRFAYQWDFVAGALQGGVAAAPAIAAPETTPATAAAVPAAPTATPATAPTH